LEPQGTFIEEKNLHELRLKEFWGLFDFHNRAQNHVRVRCLLKRYLWLALLPLLSLSLISCEKSITFPSSVPVGSGSGSGSGGGGGYGTGSPNGPMINAGITRQTIFLGGVPTAGWACQIVVTDKLGNPIAASGATLVAPGSVIVPLSNISTGYYQDSGSTWTFQPGQTYTVNITIAGTPYSGSIVLPGNVTIPPFSSPGPIVWTYPGNADTISVMEQFSPYTSSVLGPVATSGSLSTASATYFPSAGNYMIQVNVIKTNIGAFGANAYYGAVLTGTDQYGGTYTK
jgi:hypothetical protein